MAEFAAAVGDRRAADLLQRALLGRGAFRRFRDTLHDFPISSRTGRRTPAARAETRAIEQTLDAGHDVTLLRDGRPWATISPV